MALFGNKSPAVPVEHDGGPAAGAMDAEAAAAEQAAQESKVAAQSAAEAEKVAAEALAKAIGEAADAEAAVTQAATRKEHSLDAAALAQEARAKAQAADAAEIALQQADCLSDPVIYCMGHDRLLVGSRVCCVSPLSNAANMFFVISFESPPLVSDRSIVTARL